MKLIVDTHTHTIFSGHAFSTIQENAKSAKENGIEMIVMTDHGPAMNCGAALIYFGNLKILPEKIYDVSILKGVESNIIDYSGNIDIPIDYLKKLDYVIASFHDICIKPSSVEEHTNAMINALKNPFVDAIGHPGNPVFSVDIKKVVSVAKEYGKFIEINNHSFRARLGSESNCKDFANECKKQGVKIVCGSDAHFSFDIGKFDNVIKLLKEVSMPEELIINTSPLKLEEYLLAKKDRINNI